MRLVIIDSENVGYREIDKIYETLLTNSRIFCVGNKTAVDAYKNCIIYKDIENIIVDYNYRNASDFVIIALAAMYLGSEKATVCEIISDDCGFDGAIQYLVAEGYNIKRIGVKTELNKYGFLTSLCGYIAKKCTTGMSIKEAENNIIPHNNRGIDGLKQLNSLGIIEMKDGRIFFDKVKLKDIARGNIKIVKEGVTE